jgi:hypothetical protein
VDDFHGSAAMFRLPVLSFSAAHPIPRSSFPIQSKDLKGMAESWSLSRPADDVSEVSITVPSARWTGELGQKLNSFATLRLSGISIQSLLSSNLSWRCFAKPKISGTVRPRDITFMSISMHPSKLTLKAVLTMNMSESMAPQIVAAWSLRSWMNDSLSLPG